MFRNNQYWNNSIGQVNNWQPVRRFREHPDRNRFFPLVFILLSFLLLIILITGCITSAAAGPNVYLMEMSYTGFENQPNQGDGVLINGTVFSLLNQIVSGTDLKVRIGYFGVCASSTNLKSVTDKTWECSNELKTLSDFAAQVPNLDPLNLLYTGFRTHGLTFSPWLIVVVIVTSFLAMLFLALKRYPSVPGYVWSFLVVGFTFMMALLAMFWQQVSVDNLARVIPAFTDNALSAHYGKTAAGLGWAAVSLLFVCTIMTFFIALGETIEAVEDGIEDAADVFKGHVPHHSLGSHHGSVLL